MPTIAKQKHTHKFKRLTYKSGNQIFFCALPDCSVKISTALALGKRSLCWRCGEEFIMSEYSLRLAKPHCDKCHRPKGVNKEDIPYVLRDDGTKDSFGGGEPLLLSERLQQIIKQAQPEEDEI